MDKEERKKVLKEHFDRVKKAIKDMAVVDVKLTNEAQIRSEMKKYREEWKQQFRDEGFTDQDFRDCGIE